MNVIRFESSFRSLLQIPVGVLKLEQDLSIPRLSSEGISDLPTPFSSADSWVLFTQLWPDREPDDNVLEIHLAIYADHSFETIVDGNAATSSIGVFSGTLFVRDRAPLSWIRQNAPGGLFYTGLRWLVDRKNLKSEWIRISRAIQELAPGKEINISSPPLQ